MHIEVWLIVLFKELPNIFLEEVDTVALDIVYEHYQVSVEHWFFYNTHCMVTIEKIVCDVLCVIIIGDEISERKHKMEIIIIFLEYLCCV